MANPQCRTAEEQRPCGGRLSHLRQKKGKAPMVIGQISWKSYKCGRRRANSSDTEALAYVKTIQPLIEAQSR
ncbi:hypothetical protein AVEN_116594-1 [Araneus ventricosus]|uniref:Uncharacterized protein n=1 Tax=Araneus ventricosus TaxID=182803 RepID=A0A4Y2DE41_ARAVE|nr:hypothetical protein AVEN_116594-1 [Araneus ventricosus]